MHQGRLCPLMQVLPTSSPSPERVGRLQSGLETCTTLQQFILGVKVAQGCLDERSLMPASMRYGQVLVNHVNIVVENDIKVQRPGSIALPVRVPSQSCLGSAIMYSVHQDQIISILFVVHSEASIRAVKCRYCRQT